MVKFHGVPKYGHPFILLTLLVFLSSCTSLMSGTVPFDGRESTGLTNPRTATASQRVPTGETQKSGARNIVIDSGYVVPNQIQQMIVDSSLRLTEQGNLVVNGETFTSDCTGTVLAAYWGAGLNPVKYFHYYTGNGVKRLHDMGEDYELNYIDTLPNPGDVIIWDDTYDKDGNGKWGDPFTHAGVVVEVREDGQITYLHYNYVRGVVLETMNLKRPDDYAEPDGTLVNSPMRARADRHIKPDAWLASHLVRGFVPLYDYPGLME